MKYCKHGGPLCHACNVNAPPHCHHPEGWTPTIEPDIKSWFDACHDKEIERYIKQWTDDVERLSGEVDRKRQHIQEAQEYLEQRRNGDEGAQHDPDLVWP